MKELELLLASIDSDLDRRRFLKAFSGLTGSAALALMGCSDDTSQTPGGDAGADLGPDMMTDADADAGVDADMEMPASIYEFYEEVMAALRQSPDHYIARADDLVAEADPQAILDFVRDQIVTYPTHYRGVFSQQETQRWGWRATLRGGAGTPREKVELLAELYRRAGFEAEVFDARLMMSSDWRPELLRSYGAADFDPQIDDAQYDMWAEEFGSNTDAGEQIDPDQSQAEALYNSLAETVDFSNFGGGEFDFRSGSYFPMVRVTVDGMPRYANPFIADSVFGQSYARMEDESREVLEASPTIEVEVILEGVTTLEPGERIELVRGSWDASDIVGRQLYLKAEPSIPLEAAATTSIKEVKTFVPMMAWQGRDLSFEQASMMSLAGEPFLNSGEKITITDDSIAVDGSVVEGPDLPPGDPADITSLEISKIGPGRFPDVQVSVNARDENGDDVAGLRADTFQVLEDGEAVGFLMKNNVARPRAIVLADNSLSMPTEFRGEAGQTFVDALIADLLVAQPNTVVDFRTTGSNIWTSLADAAQRDPTVIIYLTDGDVTDSLTPELESILTSGPPAVMLAVDGSMSTFLQEMADLTGGIQVPVTDVPEAVQAASDFIQAQQVAPYLFSYEAPLDGPSMRNVEVRTADGQLMSSGTYEVPETPGQPKRLCGLYLTVNMTHPSFGSREYETLVSGYISEGEAVTPTQAHVDDVRDWLLGSHFLSFEGAVPPRSIWLEDVLQAHMSTRDLWNASQADDYEALTEAWDAGFNVLPSALFTATAPLRDYMTDTVIPFEDGLRVTMYSQMVEIGTDQLRQKIDIMPTSKVSIVSEGDQEARARECMRITAGTAIAEAALFDTSTVSLLDGEPLFAWLRGAQYPYRSSDTLDAERIARWDALNRFTNQFYQLYPEDGTIEAWWTIDADTGALTGRIYGGLGGGDAGAGIREQIMEIDRVIALLNLYIAAAGAAGAVNPIGGFALGVVAAYGQTLARLYGAVSVTIALLDASQLEDDVKAALLQLACNVIKSIFLAGAGGPGAAWGNIENVLSVLTIDTGTGCPG